VGLQARPGILQNAPFHNTPHSRVTCQKRTNDSNRNIKKQTRIKMLRGFLCFIFRTETMCKWLCFNSKKKQATQSVIAKFASAHFQLKSEDRLKSVLMYKILNEQSAPSLREKCIKIKDLNREYNLRSNDTDLALPKPKTNYLKRSFKYSDAMLWNSFPSEAKNASSLYQPKCSMPTIPEIKM
jgi:hypothetical protein